MCASTRVSLPPPPLSGHVFVCAYVRARARVCVCLCVRACVCVSVYLCACVYHAIFLYRALGVALELPAPNPPLRNVVLFLCGAVRFYRLRSRDWVAGWKKATQYKGC